MTNKSIPGKGELPSNSSRPLTVSDLMRVLEDMFNIPAPALREHMRFILDDDAPSSPTDFDSDDDIVVVLADPTNPTKFTNTANTAGPSSSAAPHHGTVAGTSISVSVKSKANAATSTSHAARVRAPTTPTVSGNLSIGATSPVAVAVPSALPVAPAMVPGCPALAPPVANPGVTAIAAAINTNGGTSTDAGVPSHAHLVRGNWHFAAPFYPIETFSPGPPGPFYAVTIGTRTGVFSPWGNATPYCQGIPGGTVAGYATQNQARAAYNSALVNGCVRVVEMR